MRYFPSAARQRAVGALALALLLLGALALPNAVADDERDLQQRRDQVEDRIDTRKQHLEESSQEFATASRRLGVAEARLTTARTRLATVSEQLRVARGRAEVLERELTEARGRLETATERLEEGRAETERQREDLRGVVTTAYGKGDAQLRAFGSLLKAESLDDLTVQLTVQQIVIGSNEDAYVELQDAERRLAREREEVRRTALEVGRRERAAQRQAEAVRTVFGQVRTARDDIATLVVGIRGVRQAAYRTRERDRRMLRDLRERESRITRQLRELAARQRGKAGYEGSSGGFLSPPAPGAYVTSPYGYRTHPIYGYYSLHNGIDFGTGCGTPMKAGATGRVVNQYYDSVFGNRVFLNVGNVNGRNMTLVYNHLSGYSVSVGDRVQRGGTVGLSGTTGWSTGCHLHFTVLMDGTPVDPAGYL